MDAIAFFLVIAVIILGAMCTKVDNARTERRTWINEYSKTPYCEKSTATVQGETITLERCWKVVEVK